jgi:hypothetical protein
MNLVNLTPDAITIYAPESDAIIATIPPSGTIARAAAEREQVGSIDIGGQTVPINRTVFGAYWLPNYEQDCGQEDCRLDVALRGERCPHVPYYIVSAIVAQAVSRLRSDLLIPDDAVRDGAGRIIGCRAFARVG